MDDLIERLRVEPTASHFLRVGDLVESLVAERKEAANRIAALEAEKVVNDAFRKEAAKLADDYLSLNSTYVALAAKLAEYEQAPTAATVESEHGFLYLYRCLRLPPAGTELIARPTRKDGE